MTRESPRRRRLRRRPISSGGEKRFWPAVAVIVAALVYAVLPESLLVGPRFALPAVELALLLSLVLANPRRLVRQTRWSRAVSIVLACLVIATNLVALGMLVRTLGDPNQKGVALLVAGMQVWLTNVIGFGLLFWEIDRGGPVARHTVARDRLKPADWRFSQDENHDAVTEVAAASSVNADWRPGFVDYLYLSLTNSSAFSPTDTMPLTAKAKLLMGLEATAALMTSLLVVARAVGALGQ
jgi:uncharacterized membrane protein